MRWARFRSNDGRTGFGVLDGEHMAEYDGDMYDTPRATGRTLAEGSFALASPCSPSKIVALWNNFTALSMKLGKAPPFHPLFLIKPGTSVIGPNEAIRRPTGYPGKIAYEYGFLGDKEQTFVWLENAYAAKDEEMSLLRTNRCYDFIRTNPRFLDLIKRVGLP